MLTKHRPQGPAPCALQLSYSRKLRLSTWSWEKEVFTQISLVVHTHISVGILHTDWFRTSNHYVLLYSLLLSLLAPWKGAQSPDCYQLDTRFSSPHFLEVLCGPTYCLSTQLDNCIVTARAQCFLFFVICINNCNAK